MALFPTISTLFTDLQWQKALRLATSKN